ncbi:restriction endonuclease subunit S [uncultured Prevotella sp.]|uniref:restriction endonuclease subunit S n=1 Tax=uncultured Prevotella sp. TaxID=159272 RepID=UPI0026DCFCB0|nr:restriction endonuclease subunit S [uncultured Prevotella sp.]
MRIATQSKVINRLQSLIKGIANKSFHVARETKPLLEFAPNITSGNDKNGSGTIPLYGSTGIIGMVKNASQKGNIVLVARVGTIGTVQFVNEPCGVSDNALIIEAGDMTKYIYYFLKTYNFARITSGTTQPLITASSLKKLLFPYLILKDRQILCAALVAWKRNLTLKNGIYWIW